MEERLLRRTAIGSFLCLLVVAALTIIFSHESKTKKEILDDGKKISSSQSSLVKGDKENHTTLKSDDIISNSGIGTKYISIKKPDEIKYKVQINNSYIDNRILITIENMDVTKLKDNYIKRVNQEVEFTGITKLTLASKKTNSDNGLVVSNTKIGNSVLGETEVKKKAYLIPEEIKANGSILTYGKIPKDMVVDPVNAFNYCSTNLTENNGTLIEFHMDKVYEPEILQDDKYIYIALKEPKELYKKVIVLDAGHGGKDPGAYSKGFDVYEKDINLDILLQLKDIIEQDNDIKVYYTRLADETVYLNPRVELANRVQADLFISIHCNAADSSLANGLEILYNENDTTKGLNSKKLAELLFDDLKGITGRINRGLVPASEMVIVGKSRVPVALIESGFLTNPEDYAVLSNKDKQKEYAQSIYDVILNALK